LGWAEPPPDNDLGGNELFDVYLEDLDMYIAGYVSGGEPPAVINDNPRTDHIEQTASFSYMGLDNDFFEIDELEDVTLSGLDFMRTTVAHEFNHAIQYGYDSEELHPDSIIAALAVISLTGWSFFCTDFTAKRFSSAGLCH